MYIDLGGGNKAIVGDQLAFNTLMTQGSLPWRSVDAEADWRVLRAHNDIVKVCPAIARAALVFAPKLVLAQPAHSAALACGCSHLHCQSICIRVAM